MNFKKRFTLFSCLTLSLVAFLVLQPHLAAPSNVSIFKGEDCEISLLGPYSFDAKESLHHDDYEIDVKLCGTKLKSVSVDVSDPVYLIPGGQAVGMKMHSDGPLVVGFEKIRTKDGDYNTESDCGLCMGDRIIKVDNKPCPDTDVLAQTVKEKRGEPITLTVIREDEELNIPLSAKLDETSGAYRLGLWLRDSSAGIGTITFIDPKTGRFGALGHGVCDRDTASVVKVSDGKIIPCDIALGTLSQFFL